MMSKSKKSKFAPMSSQEDEYKASSPRKSSVLHKLLLSLIVVLSASICFFSGRYSASMITTSTVACTHTVSVGLLVRLVLTERLAVSTYPKLFLYNRTFGEPPSQHVNEAWKDLFPRQGGFFKHPQLAPQRSALSVFHQLHCLVCLSVKLRISEDIDVISRMESVKGTGRFTVLHAKGYNSLVVKMRASQ